MISPESRTKLEEMSKTVYGRALKEFLDERFEAINDITTVTSWDEAVGRKFAITLLKEMFSFLEPKEPAKDKQKSQYL